MADFSLTEEQKALQSNVRQFTADRITRPPCPSDTRSLRMKPRRLCFVSLVTLPAASGLA